MVKAIVEVAGVAGWLGGWLVSSEPSISRGFSPSLLPFLKFSFVYTNLYLAVYILGSSPDTGPHESDVMMQRDWRYASDDSAWITLFLMISWSLSALKV